MSDSVGMSFKAKMNNLSKKLGLRPQKISATMSPSL